MPSVLNVDTIADAAGTGAVALTKQSAAKAYGFYDFVGGTPTNRKSLNISSLSDISAGRTTVSFTNSMDSAYYGTASISGDDNYVFKRSEIAGSFELASFNGSYRDSDMGHVTHGDLA